MAIWKQILGAAAALAAIVGIWLAVVPGARDTLAKYDILPAIITTQTEDAAKGSPGGAGRFGGPRTATVVLAPAGNAVLNDKVSALGSSSAAQSVDLLPSAAGRLTHVMVASGDTVKTGDVIAMLESDTQQIAFDSASVALADATKTLARNKQLNTGNVVSASQMQSFQLAADVAELNLRRAKLDLANRSITAPIDGTVGIVQVSVGVEVGTQTVIATIEDSSTIKIRFWLPERLVGAVKVGDPITAIPVARPQDDLGGVVSAVDNRVDAATGTFEVLASIANTDDSLQSGMSFTVSMAFPGDPYVAIPPLAVQWGSSGAFVWRVVDHVAQRIAVRIIQRNAENVLVSGDLAAGDQIVIEGLDALKDGATVEIFGEPKPDAAAPQAPTKGGGSAAVSN